MEVENDKISYRRADIDDIEALVDFRVRCLNELHNHPEDYETEILRKALREVISQVSRNAGKTPEVIIEKCDDVVGYNAKTDKFENLIEAGVIDASLVVKNALSNAVSLACMFLTTEAIVAEHYEQEDEKIPNRIKK